MDPIRELVVPLKVGGYWTYYKEGTYFYVFLYVLQHLILHGSFILNVYSVALDGPKESMKTTLPFFAPVVTLSVCHFALSLTKNRMQILLNTFKKIMNKDERIRELFNSDYLYIIMYKRIVRYAIIVILATFFVTPAIFELFRYLEVTSVENPMNIPTITAYIPFMDKGSLQHCLCSFVNMFWNIGSATSHYGFLASNFSLLTYYYIELKVFKYKITNHYSSQLFSSEKLRNKALRDIILDQEDLIELHRNLVDAIACCLAIQNTVVATCNCFYLYAITSVGTLEKRILFTYGLLVFSLDTFVCCYAADLVESEGEAVFHAIQDLPWYEMHPEDRKSINFILMQAARPTTIHFKRLAFINVQSILQIVQASYSYFMLLRSI